MKKVFVIVISVLLFFSVAVVAMNYLYPYYVHLSSVKYANEVKESIIDKDNFILCSKISEDKTVNSMYISFYVLDKASQKFVLNVPTVGVYRISSILDLKRIRIIFLQYRAISEHTDMFTTGKHGRNKPIMIRNMFLILSFI